MNSKFQTPWANISDMMAGLMMIFLFISLVNGFESARISQQLMEEKKIISDIADSYTDNRSQIYDSINEQFSSRFAEWDANLDKSTLTLRFNDPTLLFEPGSSTLTPRFETILAQFWIDYVEILEQYSSNIREIKIEGHTSSEWTSATLDEAYFNNMRLSQQRTRKTLEFCYTLTPIGSKPWVRSTVTANGMSSSRPIRTIAGAEDIVRSRRVEFTIVVDSSSRLDEILGELND
jgi:outer membrane protein OmpA-like peptidoglycan-associated protein